LEHAGFVEHHYGTPKDKEEEMRSNQGYQRLDGNRCSKAPSK
jgi:hypothetical protein